MNLVRRLIARLPGTQVEVVPRLKVVDGTPLAGFAELSRRFLISQDIVNKPELLCEVAMH